MPLLEGKNALIFGIANHRSIGWAIAQALANEGAQLAFTYQDRMEKYVRDLAAKIPGTPVIPCDVQSDEQLDAAFAQAGEVFGGGLDILIHSVAFAPPRELENPFYETTREGFHTALDISAYSLIAMANRAKPLMQARGGGSILTMTYMASERVMPKYNVMAVAKAALECSVRYLAFELGEFNIRVNAISAGPLNTLAARGISALPVSVNIWEWRHPCVVISNRARWAMRPSSSPALMLVPSPAKFSSSTRAITLWELDRRPAQGTRKGHPIGINLSRE